MNIGGADKTGGAKFARLFEARSAMAETKPHAPTPALAELVVFLTDPCRDLSLAERRSLRSDPRLRADFNRLKAALGCVELPAMVAASAGEANQRCFAGGTTRVHPSRVPGQVYVLFQFMWPSGPPQAILLEGASGEVVKRPLPVADASGQAVLVLDRNRAPDDMFLRLISDPTTTGSFIL